MSPAKSFTLLILVVLMTLLTPAPPAGADFRGTFTVDLLEGGTASSMICFSRQNDGKVAVICESAATAGTCGMTVTTLRGEWNDRKKTVSLTGTTPVRNADCSVEGIECMKMTLTMNGSSAATGYGIRRFCTAGADSSFTVAASRTSFTSIDRNQDLDRNGTPELLWESMPSGQFHIWYMEGKGGLALGVLEKKYVYRNFGGKFVAAADFNSDGKPDLLLTNNRGEVIIVMQKDGAFHNENEMTAMTNTGRRVVGTGDFDGDGYPDIVVQDVTTGRIFVHFWNGSRFINGKQIGVVDDTAWRAVGVGDFDFDNQPDILLHNEVTGAVAVWHMNGTNVIGVSSLPNTDPVWHAHALLDLNNDGHPDIVWRNNSTGEVAAWYMNETHKVLSASLVTVSDHNWQLAGGLAYSDSFRTSPYNYILWRHQPTGGIAVWLTAGTTYQSVSYIQDSQAIPSLKDTAWKIAATGDLNGDNRGDILWQSQVTGKTAVWFMNGKAVLGSQEMAQVTNTNLKIVGTGDFDGDGHSDILLHNQATGGVRLWLMNGTSFVREVSLGGAGMGWRIGGVGSFYTGKMDIFFQESATGRIAVWHMNGTERVSSKPVSTPGDKNWLLVGVGDFSGNGTWDLLVQNQVTGAAAVWLMTGTDKVWAVRSIGYAADPSWKIAGAFR